MSKNVILIVPCYNEANRIDLAAFHKAPGNVRFLFVDDGSRDGTAAKIESGKPVDAALLRLPRNCGKAEAVRQGMLHVLNHPGIFPGCEMVGFWDADLATPLDEVPALEAQLLAAGRGLDAVIGSRVKKLGSKIERSWTRHILGRIFTTISDNLLNLSAYDSQCGAKIFRKDVIDKAFAEPFVSRWVFDVEVLLRLGTDRVLESPLRAWKDVRGSKINIPSASFRIIRDLWVIRRRYKK